MNKIKAIVLVLFLCSDVFGLSPCMENFQRAYYKNNVPNRIYNNDLEVIEEISAHFCDMILTRMRVTLSVSDKLFMQKQYMAALSLFVACQGNPKEIMMSILTDYIPNSFYRDEFSLYGLSLIRNQHSFHIEKHFQNQRDNIVSSFDDCVESAAMAYVNDPNNKFGSRVD